MAEEDQDLSTIVVPEGFARWDRPQKNIYLQGAEAAKAGRGEDACPYEKNGDNACALPRAKAYHRAWHMGYDANKPKEGK